MLLLLYVVYVNVVVFLYKWVIEVIRFIKVNMKIKILYVEFCWILWKICKIKVFFVIFIIYSVIINKFNGRWFIFLLIIWVWLMMV